MRILERILAVADKEWRLNLRFPLEYVANNVAAPLKSAILMYFLYRGLLTGNNALGVLRKENFTLFVLVGTTCHSLFLVSLSTFRYKMVMEKYWLTITATLVSPASMMEVILGFIIGSIGIHLLVAALIIAGVAISFHIAFSTWCAAMVVLFLLSLIGFGIGLLGTTMSLVWEGYAFVFDYATQMLIFISCFYYPIETIPNFAHPFIRVLPTYQAAQLVQQLFLTGYHQGFMMMFGYVVLSSVSMLVLASLLMDFSVKKYGIVGY